MSVPRFQRIRPPSITLFHLLLGAAAVSGAAAQTDPGTVFPQPAYTAEQFVDFVGLSASPFDRYLDSGKFAGAGTKYPAEVFFDLGVRHYRMALRTEMSKSDAAQSVRAAYAKHGARPMMLVSPGKDGNSPVQVFDIIRMYGGSEVVGEIEGPNECNNKFPPQELNLHYGGQIDEAGGAAYMRDLCAARAQDPDASRIPIVNFTAIFTDYRLAHPCDAFDANNMHSYQGQQVPSASLLRNFASANHILPVGAVIKPFVVTECGYNVEEDKSNHLGVGGSLHAQAWNIPMLLGEYFRHGFIRRTYLFALHNADGYGLMESDQRTLRPSYHAVQTLLAALRDATWNPATRAWEGGKFRPRALLSTAANAPATFKSLTLQKQDGSYFLMLWNELPNWDGDNHHALEHAPTRVTLRFAAPMAAEAQVWRQDDDGSIRPAETLAVADGTLTVDVPSTVVLVRVRPARVKPEHQQSPPAQVRNTATENSVALTWQPPAHGSPSGGYFVFRNGWRIASTKATALTDDSPWIRPRLGYTYEVQAYDTEGDMSERVPAVVQTAAKFPDLVVTSFGVQGGQAVPGEPARFRAKLKNVGDGATPHGQGAAVTFHVDGEYAAFGGTGSPILPGEEREIVTGGGGPNRNGTWTVTPGAHLVSYLIDDQDIFPEEKSKSNNVGDQLLVVGAASQGVLQAASQAAPWKVDLSQEGTEDWVQWVPKTPSDVTRKADANLIGALSKIGEGAFLQTPGFTVRTAWSDGTPERTVEAANSGLWTNHVGSGYAFDAPADTAERTLKVYGGGACGATCVLSATLSDGSAPGYVAAPGRATGDTVNGLPCRTDLRWHTPSATAPRPTTKPCTSSTNWIGSLIDSWVRCSSARPRWRARRVISRATNAPGSRRTKTMRTQP